MNQNAQRKPAFYFWKDYSAREVDYLEIYNDQISAYEFKWKTGKPGNLKAFQITYKTARTHLVTSKNVHTEFLVM